MRLVIGIDPGVTGALARISDYGDRLSYDWVEDMPVLEATRGRRKVDAARTAALIRAAQHPLSRVFTKVEIWIEDTHAMPKNGSIASESLGRSKGVVEGIAATLEIPLYLVSPQKWKRYFSLKSGKDAARAKASELMPRWVEMWRLKKHHNRAEAALIALYGVRQGGGNDG